MSAAPVIQPGDRFLKRPEVIRRVGLQKSAIYDRIGKGTFPKPISLSTTAARWLESDIDAWMAAQIQTTNN